MPSQTTLAADPPAPQATQDGEPVTAAASATTEVTEAKSLPDGLGSGPGPRHSGLGPDLQAVIGQQLRAVYHEVLNEPVPDRFVKLLAELAKKEAGRS